MSNRESSAGLPAFAMPSSVGFATASAVSGDMKIGRLPSPISPASRMPPGVMEAQYNLNGLPCRMLFSGLPSPVASGPS